MNSTWSPPTPSTGPTERMGTESSMRRLFQVHFSCPLCGQEHSCELYLTLEAQNTDEMMERALETLGRDDVKVNSLAPFMKEYHQRAGDYLERATGYARRAIRYPFQVTRGGHDRRGKLYLRVLQPEVRNHRRLAAARR